MARTALIARRFDESKSLVSTRSQKVNGVQLQPGDEISPDLHKSLRVRLWLTRLACYADDYRPTAYADPKPEDVADDPDAWKIPAHGVEVIEGENGWYGLKIDGVEEIENVHGADAAKARVEEIRAEKAGNDETTVSSEAGPEEGEGGAGDAGDDPLAAALANGVSVEETGGGWYEVKAAWLDAPVKVQGQNKANAKAVEIAATKGDDAPGE